MIQAPPRHGKSEFISKYLQAYFPCRYPDRRSILASYQETFAATWGLKARDLVKEFGQQWFGVRVRDDKSARNDWEVEAFRDGRWQRFGGGMVTAGIGGSLTGRGAHLLTIDDPIKNSEEALSTTIREKHWDWWESTALTRLEPGGVAIVMATRWNEDDLSGRLLKQAQTEEGEPVALLDLPAIAGENDHLGRAPGEPLWSARYSLADLTRTKNSIDNYWWQALYQQKPTKHRNAEFSDEYFGAHAFYTEPPKQSEIRWKVMALDPSLGKTAKADYSAYVMLTGTVGGIVYVDANIERRDLVRMIDDGGEIYKWFKPDVWAVETNAFHGLTELINMRWDGVLPRIAEVTQHRDKVDRIKVGLTPMLANGLLRFKNDSIGVERLIEQLKEFPAHKHDDGPDALEMGLRTGEQMELET